ncbi:MAG TPA: DUF3817 domain-containing protein [Bacteroidia bacterium]
MVGKIEGYSYLALLLIAMPLKRIFDLPIAVTIVGSIHGILFILFMYQILKLLLEKDFSFKQSFYAFLLSILPFGTFFLGKLLPKAS